MIATEANQSMHYTLPNILEMCLFQNVREGTIEYLQRTKVDIYDKRAASTGKMIATEVNWSLPCTLPNILETCLFQNVREGAIETR